VACGYSDQVHDRVRELVNLHPNIFTLQTVSKTIDGYSAIMQVVTVELGDRSVPEKDKLRIMLVCSPIISAYDTASCLWGGIHMRTAGLPFQLTAGLAALGAELRATRT